METEEIILGVAVATFIICGLTCIFAYQQGRSLNRLNQTMSDFAFISIVSDLISSDDEQARVKSLMIEIREFQNSGPHTEDEIRAWGDQIMEKYNPVGLPPSNES